MLLALVFFLLAGMINLGLGLTPVGYAAAMTGFAVVVLGMWWRSRWHGDLDRMCLALAVALSGVMLPANWLFNGGASGPTLLFHVATMIFVIGALESRRRWRLGLVALLLLSPLVLLALEHSRPQWIHGYASGADRLLDLALSYPLAAVLVGLMIRGHSQRFRVELARASSYAQQLKAVAERDSLTGLHNRRFLHLYAESLADSAGRDGFKLAVLLLDLDRFKAVNDSHGHDMGDDVLRAVAATLVANVRASDVVVRYGGEEFLVILPDMPSSRAAEVAEKLRGAVASLRISRGSVVLRPTVSVGVAHLPTDGADLDGVVRHADAALYSAKAGGRNRVGNAAVTDHRNRRTGSG